MNAITEGRKLKLGYDYFAEGFSRSELNDAYYRLICDKRQAQLLCECAEFAEIDEEYNPGFPDNDRETTQILEAVRVRHFGQTAKTMAALQRVLNKTLEASPGMPIPGATNVTEAIQAGDAIIGEPKKSGMFATVTVQFPLSDGQTLSIIFHSPENNKMKITSEDEILAFRWLLNKRDITAAVSPDEAESGTLPSMTAAKDVSLEQVGKRCAQLIVKNSAKFNSTQKEIVEQKATLEETKAAVTAQQATNATLQGQIADAQNQAGKFDSLIDLAQTRLQKIKDFNDNLQSQIDALKAQQAGNKGNGDQGGNTPDAKALQAEKDAAEVERLTTVLSVELTGRGFVQYDHLVGNPWWFNGPDGSDLSVYFTKPTPDSFKGFNLDTGGVVNRKGRDSFNIAVGYNRPDGTRGDESSFKSKTIDGITTATTKALAWIDKKLAEMKKAEKRVDPVLKQALDDPITHEAWTLPADYIKGMSVNDYGSIINDLTESNYHTEVLLMEAKRGGTAQDIEDAETILRMRDANNGLSSELNVWQQELSRWIAGIGNQAPLDKAKAAALAAANKKPETVNPPPPVDEDPTVAAALATLDEILGGKYPDSDTIGAKLDEAAAALETAGLMEQYDGKLNEAADYLTEIMAKEAA